MRSGSSEEAINLTPKIQPTRRLTANDSNISVNVVDPSDSALSDGEAESEHGLDVEFRPPPLLLRPPPKSPLRSRSVRRDQEQPQQQRQQHRQVVDDRGISAWAKNAASPPSAAGSPPRRVSPHIPRTGAGLSRVNSIAAESTRASIGNASFLESPIGVNPPSEYGFARQSVASSAMTDTTATTQVSSILDNHHYEGGNNKFGTVRTMTTDVTSEVPSMGRMEGAAIADELGKAKMQPLPPVPPPKGSRERRTSTTPGHAIDLTRVAEEPDDGSSSGHSRNRDLKGKGKAESPTKGGEVGEGGGKKVENPVEKVHAVNLRKAKWPDDFLEVFRVQMQDSTSSSLDPEESLSLSAPSPTYMPPLSRSVSPPKKVAIVGMSAGRRADGSNESVALVPRRPTHLSRHSVDTPASLVSGSTSTLASASTGGLLPKESIFRRDTSPDGRLGSGNRVLLRRASTNKSPLPILPSQRAGSSLSVSRHTPDSEVDSGDARDMKREKRGSGPVPVPFPRRSPAGDHSGSPSPSPRMEVRTSAENASGSGRSSVNGNTSDKAPRPPRGRFQSEINGSSRLKGRPNSYDDQGANLLRTRFESMVNLGRADSAMMSASDLMARSSMDGSGSAVKKTLVVREEGKPPTHFVSFPQANSILHDTVFLGVFIFVSTANLLFGL